MYVSLTIIIINEWYDGGEFMHVMRIKEFNTG